MARIIRRDNRFEELKDIERIIENLVIRKIKRTPAVYSEYHMENNSEYLTPKATLTITVEVDITGMELTEKEGKWYVKKR